MYHRLQHFRDLGDESAFFWGPRQTGKSTLLRELFPHARYYDLLEADQYQRLLRHPELIRQELDGVKKPQMIIIDEVQRVPLLLDEAQWIITRTPHRLILCGSSARKLKRGGGNLLGGRALRYELFPLVFPEIPDFNLQRALNNGMLPRHYAAEDSRRMMEAYVGDYLKEEIAAEALVRNVPTFSRFLEVAALSNGELVNYQNIARECGISAPTVREYFQILQDTLLGFFLPSYQKRPKRRTIVAPKFYYFDLGLPHFLLKYGTVGEGGEVFGKAFEHFILQELVAHRHYRRLQYGLHFWRTTSQLEVDFILGDHEVAVEVKTTTEAQSHHLRGLKAFAEEYHPRRSILVSQDRSPRKVGNIEILPWKVFLEELWTGKIIS